METRYLLVIFNKAVFPTLQTQIHLAFSAPHSTGHFAALQLAAPGLAGCKLRPVVVTVSADSICGVSTADRVTICSSFSRNIQVGNVRPAGSRQVLCVHEGGGHRQLVLVQRQLRVVSHLLPENEGVGQRNINEVVQNPFVPLRRLRLEPVKK